MTAGVSLFPELTGNTFPAPSIPGLSDDEQRLVIGLSSKLTYLSTPMLVRNAYYNGEQRLQDLGISIPPSMVGVRTVVDWPRICVDPIVQRCVVDGFRMPGATDVDEDLWGHWQANDMDAEAPLAFLDALVFGRSYMIVGSPDEPGDSPIISVESPLNMSMTWDPRTRRPTAAYQAYEAEGVFRAVLYTPQQTISMSRELTGDMGWTVDDRDVHNFGEVPVVRLVNRARTADREGRSEITPSIMATTDSACRTLLGMEIAREFYSVPHRYILGAQESDFVNADGSPKTAMALYMSKILAFERDEENNVPSVGQFTAYDPSVFTKIIDEHAQLMASYTGFPPSYFGLTTTANPASADAIRVAETGLIRRATWAQQQFSDSLEQVQRLVWRFANGGQAAPADMRRLETDWVDPAPKTPAATADAIFKQVQMGAIPATSDVTLSALGWTGVERARLEVDRKLDATQSLLAELSISLGAKEARADTTIARDINPSAAKASAVNPTGAVTPPANVQPPAAGPTAGR